ncbi:YbgA family protein [Thermoproteota archaeon]
MDKVEIRLYKKLIIAEVDGFILKGRSPTSALKDARRYSGPNPSDAIRGKGPRFFGMAILERFSHLALEEEGRLRNPNIKSNFLTKLFTLANFREVKKSKSSKEILKFHSENKLLLKAFNEKEMRILGRIVAKRDQYSVDNLISDYEEHLFLALKRAPRCGSQINVLMNSMGYFSKSLSGDEKEFFLKSLTDYNSGVIPLSVLTGIFNSWLLRFKDDYLLSQSFFDPYPKELVDIDLTTSYCDGKDYWK